MTRIGKAGVNLLRVKSTDTAATQAAGWQTSFDSTVVITVAKGTAGIVMSSPAGDGTTIDGRQDGGITINITDNSSGIEFDGTGVKDVTFRYIKVWGPGIITQSGDVRQLNLTPSSPASNFVMQHCEVGGGGDSGMYLVQCNKATDRIL